MGIELKSFDRYIHIGVNFKSCSSCKRNVLQGHHISFLARRVIAGVACGYLHGLLLTPVHDCSSRNVTTCIARYRLTFFELELTKIKYVDRSHWIIDEIMNPPTKNIDNTLANIRSPTDIALNQKIKL